MSEDNNTRRARAALSEDIPEEDKAKLQQLLSQIEEAEANGLQLHEQFDAIREQKEQNSNRLAELNVELVRWLPANPLGNLTLNAAT